MDIDETDADEIEAEIEMRAEIDGARTALYNFERKEESHESYPES